MIRTGLDRLSAEPERLAGRRYGLLGHAASITHEPGGGWLPAHLALARSGAGPAAALFGPEHGFYAVEQDMVAAGGGRDPLTGARLVSLYGDDEASLVPRPEAFEGLDLLIIDLQDVGSRYYTYAATAVWAAEVALAGGCEVWMLDRPNPLGGRAVEGNLPEPGLESFVGAFRTPVRHGLTLGELFLLEARRRGFPGEAYQVILMEGWSRGDTWDVVWGPGAGGVGGGDRPAVRPWVAPSPNMPWPVTTALYPGLCLVEATTLSEGRGTTRPFHLVGAPGVEPRAVVEALGRWELPGVDALPTYFRPQFQKHAGAVCAGVELLVTDAEALRPYWTGLALLAAFHEAAPEAFGWREQPYEFVDDRPAIDLLTGSPAYRRVVEADGEGLEELAAGWTADEAAFQAECQAVLLYPDRSEDRGGEG